MGILKRKKLLGAVVIGIVCLAWFATRGGEGKQANYLERGATRVMAPLLALGQGLGAKISGVYRHYFALAGVSRENQRLKSELQDLQSKYIKLKEISLSPPLGPIQEGEPSLQAQVIAQDPKSHYRTLTIDRGRSHGVKVGGVVLARGALVGRVIGISEQQARVVLINDPRSIVAVMDQGSRARGMLVGKKHQLGLDRDFWITQGEYFSAKEEIQTGDLLLTSGLDGLFPKGLPVGWVRGIKKDSYGMFYRAEVEPYAPLQKLETVQVIL